MILKPNPHLLIFKGCGVFYLLVCLCGCGQVQLVKETRALMDTFCEISCYSSNKGRDVAAIDAAFKEMERIEKVFSKFDENSEIAKINNLAGANGVIASKEVFNLAQDAVYYSKISEGAFDITVGPLMDVWGFVRKKGLIPDENTLNDALNRVGYKNLELDPKGLSIRFLKSGVKMDFGGIAKGYAVDRAKYVLLKHGIKDALINLGGNIFALGAAPGKDYWIIGVEDPRDKKRLLYSFKLKNKAISTSGNYERFFEMNGIKYSHIIDPVTGMPSQGIISVTVVSDSAEQADALSTAIFVMGEEKGLKLSKSIDNTEVFILKEDGKSIAYP